MGTDGWRPLRMRYFREASYNERNDSTMSADRSHVCFIGHPFTTLGVGEQFRSHIESARAVHLPHAVMDIFRYANRSDPAHIGLIKAVEVEVAPPGIRIFHVNGDEVDAVLEAFAARGGNFTAGYNIIVPAWELPRYPAEWAKKLELFDEIWALSTFIKDSLRIAGLESIYIGQAVDIGPMPFVPRKYFGIRESAFILLHFFDLSSYTNRKNPDAVLEMFAELQRQSPLADVELVLKIKSTEGIAEWTSTAALKMQNLHCITTPMSTLEVQSLIRSADCFVSLHRAEGFGRGAAEAMRLGRLAMATGWSGNLDYMAHDNSLLVNYKLIDVNEGEYPHSAGQLWAEPDIRHAVELLYPVIEDQQRRITIAQKGQQTVRQKFSFRSVGLRILKRVRELQAT